MGVLRRLRRRPQAGGHGAEHLSRSSRHVCVISLRWPGRAFCCVSSARFAGSPLTCAEHPPRPPLPWRCPPEIIARVDTVTELTMLKRPFKLASRRSAALKTEHLYANDGANHAD